MKSIFREYKTIDLVINCVGRNISVAESELSEAIWDEVISANLKPAFFLCKFYLRYRSENSSGCIINFSSTAGIRPLPSSPQYITAKAGLIALSTYYAKIMAPHVRVNVIAPGFVQTQKHNSSDYDYFMISSGTNQFPMPQIWKDSTTKELETDFLYRWYTDSRGFQCITSAIKVYEDYISGQSPQSLTISRRRVCMTTGGCGVAYTVFDYLSDRFPKSKVILVGMNYSLYERIAKKYRFAVSAFAIVLTCLFRCMYLSEYFGAASLKEKFKKLFRRLFLLPLQVFRCKCESMPRKLFPTLKHVTKIM